MNTKFVPKGPIYRDQEDKLRLESRNGVVQVEFVLSEISQWGGDGSKFTPDLIRELQRLAVNQIYRCSGHFRDGCVRILGVSHQPPDHGEVPALVEEMCG